MGRKSKAKRLERSENAAEGPRPAKGGARRFWLLIAAGIIALCLLGGVSAALVMRGGGGGSNGQQATAAILDQLSSRTPNQDFADKAASTLSDAGYNVDYYPGDTVNVDAYRNLASHGYKIVVLRAHSAVPRTDLTLPTNVDPAVLQKIMDQIGDDVLLFTAEPYDGKTYLEDQKALRLFPVVYAGDDMSKTYFAVSAGFIESNMQGQFDGTIVILMGCSSLATDKTAAAFIDRGAQRGHRLERHRLPRSHGPGDGGPAGPPAEGPHDATAGR